MPAALMLMNLILKEGPHAARFDIRPDSLKFNPVWGIYYTRSSVNY